MDLRSCFNYKSLILDTMSEKARISESFIKPPFFVAVPRIFFANYTNLNKKFATGKYMTFRLHFIMFYVKLQELA